MGKIMILFDGDVTRIRKAARKKIHEIEEKIRKLRVKKKEIESVLTMCLYCEGCGKVRLVSTHSPSRIKTCDACNGTGKWQKRSALPKRGI